MSVILKAVTLPGTIIDRVKDGFKLEATSSENSTDSEENTDKEEETDDELEQHDWNGEAEPGKQKKSRQERKKEKEQSIQRKRDAAKIQAGGDFQVQVNIIKAEDLTPKDSGKISDPVVTVTINDEKKSTKIKKKTNNPRWDQVLYFELNGLECDELSRGKALIQVYDADPVSFNDLIGAFEFDLAWIYYREHHEVYNQWIGLTNTEETEEDVKEKQEEEADGEQQSLTGIDGIEGYLKLSITILGPNDEQYIHDEQEEEFVEEAKLDAGMILISRGVEQIPHLLTIKIYECKELTKTDIDMPFSKNKDKKNLDPFFYVEYAGVRLRSDKYKGTSPENVCIYIEGIMYFLNILVSEYF